MASVENWFEKSVAVEFVSQVAAFGPKLMASLIVLGAFWVFGAAVKAIVTRISRKHDSDKADVLSLIGQSLHVGLLVFGVVTALGTVGVNVSALVAGLGLTGFALGFAFRDVLSNLLAGVLILIHRPFRRGDRISVMGFEGTVVRIDLRYTNLEGEGKLYLIPNSSLFTNPLVLTRPTVNPGPLNVVNVDKNDPSKKEPSVGVTAAAVR